MPPLIHLFSFLGQRHPTTEGLAFYAQLGLGNWSRKGVMLVACGVFTVGMPALFMVGGSYLARLGGLGESWTTPCAMLLAVLTTGINLLGVEKLGWLNRWVVLLIVGAVGGISLGALPMIAKEVGKLDAQALSGLSVNNIWLAASIVFFVFQGWENLTFGFGELKNPQRDIPRIYWLSFAFVALISLCLATAVSAAALAGHPAHGLSGLAALLPSGPAGQVLLALIALILVANANACVFPASRAFYAAATAGALPAAFARTNHKNLPARSLWLALIVYLSVMLLQVGLDLTPAQCFLASTQCCILLYGAVILAFWKNAPGWKNRLIAFAALAAWLFLMQGFGWLIVYPLTLLAIGAVMTRIADRRSKARRTFSSFG
jgi:amino acid transporter